MRLNKQTNSSKGKHSGGGFVKEATIKGVELQYDVKEEWMKDPADIQIVITYNDGQDWDDELKLFGNFNREKESWGGALKIKMFFEAAGIKDTDNINDDWTIPESWLDEVVGKQILVLDYPTIRNKPNGKPWWETFKEVCAVSRGRDHLKKRFLKQVSEGWVKDYRTDDPATDFDFGENKEPKQDFKELDL